MISCRISEENFRILREICLDGRFVSLSDLVRTAVEELVLKQRSEYSITAIHSAVETLSTRIEVMDRDLKELISSSVNNIR